MKDMEGMHTSPWDTGGLSWPELTDSVDTGGEEATPTSGSPSSIPGDTMSLEWESDWKVTRSPAVKTVHENLYSMPHCLHSMPYYLHSMPHGLHSIPHCLHSIPHCLHSMPLSTCLHSSPVQGSFSMCVHAHVHVRCDFQHACTCTVPVL